MPENTQAQGSELNDQLDRRICPGCGVENPPSENNEYEYFCCKECGWESDMGNQMPTVGEIIQTGMYANSVDLGAFLKTLLKAV